jgi:peptidoglycan/LPS O-acetylase OafA/YrhL
LSTNIGGEAKFYRPELDGLRFFAFFSVFIHHSLQSFSTDAWGQLARALGPAAPAVLGVASLVEQTGNFGMSLFFVLSAYLITELLLIEWKRTGTVRIRDFYTRRILRIWPLYFFFLGFIAVLGIFYPETFAISGGRLAAFLLLSANWYLIYHSFPPVVVGILWSISVEEQFYLIWPGIVKLGHGRRGAAIASGVFALVSVLTLLYLGGKGTYCEAVWFNSLVEFLFFAVGAQIALFALGRPLKLHAGLRVLLILSGLGLWLVAAGATHIMLQPGAPLYRGQLLAGYGLVALGTSLLFFGVLGIRAEVVPQWLRYLGKISYGLYVYHILMRMPAHWVVLTVAEKLNWQGKLLIAARSAIPLVALAFTIGIAALSYRYLESPFLRLRRRFTTVASRPV